MRRIAVTPRAGWPATVAAQGLTYHTDPDGRVYWNESACYEFTADEIDALEAATRELHARCLEAARVVIEQNRLAEIGVPAAAHDAIRWSWLRRERSVYGRFDLAYAGADSGPPKLLEYNADTPTSLVEAAVAQWYWLQDVAPDADQFNSLWEGLVEAWRSLSADGALPGTLLYCASGRSGEDEMTAALMRDTAEAAGIATEWIAVRDIGWDAGQRRFVDLAARPIDSVFKLYPWEWLLADPFGAPALESYGRTRWVEPIWKLVLSSKGILPVLWQLFPGHPNLLPCYAGSPRGLTRYAAKPVISREGANVTLRTPESGDAVHTGGPYAAYPRVYQELYPLPCYDGNYPVLGSWIVAGEARGLGVRESDGPITDNASRFVPHLFR